MRTSFLSEHSVELIAVPKIIGLLREEYSKITPIYFWSSREGSNLGKDSFRNQKVYLVALYARRPKIENIDDQTISIKINEVLFLKSKFFSAHGIPTLACCPLVSKLEDFTNECDFVWFNLSNLDYSEDMNFRIDKECRYIPRDSSLNGIVEEYDLIDSIKRIAEPMEWTAAIDLIKNKSNSETNYGRGFFNTFFGFQYKPVYLILQEHKLNNN